LLNGSYISGGLLGIVFTAINHIPNIGKMVETLNSKPLVYNYRINYRFNVVYTLLTKNK